MNDTPFGFIPANPGRSMTKPRRTGRTMVLDPGIPVGRQNDILEMAGRYVDIAKIKTGMARLYDEAYLKRKISIYRSHELEVFPGGQFLEYVLHAVGEDAVSKYWDEALRLGFTAIEVSDNVVPLSDDLRVRLIKGARAAGLRVFGEVGAKEGATDGQILIRQAELSLEAGADLVLVEAAELVVDRAINRELLDEIIEGLDMSQVLIELPGSWISGVSQYMVNDLEKLLIRELGPDVNLGNVGFDVLMDSEANRTGLGVAGPPGAAGGRDQV